MEDGRGKGAIGDKAEARLGRRRTEHKGKVKTAKRERERR